MWVVFKEEHSLSAALKLKGLLEGQWLPCRLLPPKGEENGTYKVLVPRDREHLISEELRKA